MDPDDGLPQQICSNCVYQLTITQSFKFLIEKSIQTLSQNVSVLYSCKENVTFDSDNDNKINDQNSFKIDKYENPTLNNYETKTKLYCAVCKEQFLSSFILYQHCQEKHPPRNINGRECEYCKEKFTDFKSLIMHRKLHFTPYICDGCWQGFDAIEEMKYHSCPSLKEGQLKEPEKVLKQCDQCGKSYPKGYFKIHLLIHGEKRAYSCDYCPKKFKVRCSLNSHVLWKHQRTRNHKCNICNATFISASSKSTHVRKHHLKEKKHSCDSCGKCFFSKSEIERHMLTHTGVKNFHCHMCDKSYQTRYGLNVHLRTHNQTSGQSYHFSDVHFTR